MSSKDDAFLEEARLGPRTRVLIECEEIPNLSRLGRRFREIVLADLAHAVMLTETGILASERGERLLEGLLDMHDSNGAGFPYLAESGSFLVQTEHYLAGGWGRTSPAVCRPGVAATTRAPPPNVSTCETCCWRSRRRRFTCNVVCSPRPRCSMPVRFSPAVRPPAACVRRRLAHTEPACPRGWRSIGPGKRPAWRGRSRRYAA